LTFSLETGHTKLHEINQSIYEIISFMKINSSDDINYQCYVIATLRHRRSVHFFDINGDQANFRNLNYCYPRAKSFKCHISDDYKAMTLVNVKENYLLTFSTAKNGSVYTQLKNLSHLKNTIVKYIEPDDTGSGFFYASHKMYD
jgi:hypothetical protein